MEKVVLAKVGDIEITKEQMIGILRNLPQEHQQSVAGEEGRLHLLEEMIAGELLYLDATKNKLEEEEGFLAILAEAKRGLLQRYAATKLFEGIDVSEEETVAYYEANKDQFTNPPMATAKHILVDTEEKASEIKSEIDAGKSFEEAAMEYSTCPSKERGGELGQFGRGQMVPEFEEAAFGGEVGVVSDPVKTQFGYHLILVDSISEAGEQPLNEVVDTIRATIGQGKQASIYEAKIEELKKENSVEVFPEALK